MGSSYKPLEPWLKSAKHLRVHQKCADELGPSQESIS